MGAADVGRAIVVIGLVLVVLGGILVVAGRLPIPGNFVYRRGNLTVFAPIGLMLLVSVVLTVVLNIVLRVGR